jgi:hypothetical protein
MAKPENVEVKVEVPAAVWIGRLRELLIVVAAMDKDERAAAFSFLKSKYRQEWPSENY